MPISERDFMQRPDLSRGQPADALKWLMGLNIAVFVAQYGFGLAASRVEGFAFQPWGGLTLEGLRQGHLWLLLSHAFVHGSLGHVLLNLMMLHFGGGRLQRLVGPQGLLQVYVLGALFGGLLESAVGAMIGEEAYLIGASAAVMATLLALAVLEPVEQVQLLLLFVIPVRFSMRGLGRFLTLTSLGMGLLGLFGSEYSLVNLGGARVAEFAHFGGCVAGWLWARRWLQASKRNGAPFLRPRPEAVASPQPEPMNAQRSLREEVDQILEQINAHGLQSLSAEQRRTLELASQLWRDR